MKNVGKFLKKNSFPVFLILFGCLIFFWTRNYKEVPSGIGPAFFPRVVAVLMIGLSAVCIWSERNKDVCGEVSPDRQAVTKIGMTVAALIIMVLLMKYVHPLAGIFLFLFFYLNRMSGLTVKNTLLISVVGTAVLYGVILALRIPM